MILSDLRCQAHDIPLVFVPEDAEYRCPQSNANYHCDILTIADILLRLNGNIGYVEYVNDK